VLYLYFVQCCCTCCLLQELYPAYLEHYYSTAPPRSNNTADNSSWMQLEARAAATPGFARFVSPSLHVRVFSASAILFWVSGATAT
jgi:hypothetical protein